MNKLENTISYHGGFSSSATHRHFAILEPRSMHASLGHPLVSKGALVVVGTSEQLQRHSLVDFDSKKKRQGMLMSRKPRPKKTRH